ncbi:RNA 2',3'-cyclic phosphodiesterase [Entomohabitans teleogrylli]|uniref:RNA 2',3'-cyclic phosphodiesterase n=1 Tax=Entomohabitans teleogrylli TaxID=1384589 RepID=UPI00073D5C79|nr:RNA 2',3'-cyclic phosphodiesterase [Entomohabitans teleogrylli]
MSATRRLFFGLALPTRLQRQLVRWRADHFAEYTGRPVAAANLHMTLAFLGDVSPEKQQALSVLAGRIRQPRFALQLDDAGHWLRSRVIWLGTRQPPRGLLQLADLLRSQAARSGCHQSPQPFHPHITLWRQAVSHAALPAPGFNWQCEITEFTLFESCFDQGRTRYQTLESWPLT